MEQCTEMTDEQIQLNARMKAVDFPLKMSKLFIFDILK